MRWKIELEASGEGFAADMGTLAHALQCLVAKPELSGFSTSSTLTLCGENDEERGTITLSDD